MVRLSQPNRVVVEKFNSQGIVSSCQRRHWEAIILNRLLSESFCYHVPKPGFENNDPMPNRFGILVCALMLSGCFQNPPIASIADLGEPSRSIFNGLVTVRDLNHHVPKQSIALDNIALPQPLKTATPSIPNIRVLARRDAAIVYVPNVAGAADYRVYSVDNNLSFVGQQPRGAVIACAGYKQYPWHRQPDVNGSTVRELLQVIELPGLTKAGEYTLIVEALQSPCPFTGLMGHSSAKIPISNNKLQALTGGAVPVTGFDDARAFYGNEILNGQGSSSDWRIKPGQFRGQAVGLDNLEIPINPTVIARSAIKLRLPFADESLNAPILDVGSNATFDDFGVNLIGTDFSRTSFQFGDQRSVQGKVGRWYAWGRGAQAAINDPEDNAKGVQVWQRHGRMYTMFGDWAQDVFADLHFTSLETPPLELDDTKYVHSFFRVESGATGRRYWHWMMCGAANISDLVDPSSNVPRLRPGLVPAFYDGYARGDNPTSQQYGAPDSPYYNQECLQLLQLASFYPPTLTDPKFQEPQQSLKAVINPAGSSAGIINLTPNGYDAPSAQSPAINWRLDKNQQYAGPILEPGDQQNPLTHFDIFVRKDRMLLFVNGRQAVCWDLAATPLTMKYGLPMYGSVLYHSDAEYGEWYRPESLYSNDANGLFHYMMNTPAADVRSWDAVGQSEKIEIPSLFNFEAATCFKPKSSILEVVKP